MDSNFQYAGAVNLIVATLCSPRCLIARAQRRAGRSGGGPCSRSLFGCRETDTTSFEGAIALIMHRLHEDDALQRVERHKPGDAEEQHRHRVAAPGGRW